MNVGTKNIKTSMIHKLADMVWRAVERLYALPEDIFDFEDDENAIIDE